HVDRVDLLFMSKVMESSATDSKWSTRSPRYRARNTRRSYCPHGTTDHVRTGPNKRFNGSGHVVRCKFRMRTNDPDDVAGGLSDTDVPSGRLDPAGVSQQSERRPPGNHVLHDVERIVSGTTVHHHDFQELRGVVLGHHRSKTRLDILRFVAH